MHEKRIIDIECEITGGTNLIRGKIIIKMFGAEKISCFKGYWETFQSLGKGLWYPSIEVRRSPSAPDR